MTFFAILEAVVILAVGSCIVALVFAVTRSGKSREDSGDTLPEVPVEFAGEGGEASLRAKLAGMPLKERLAAVGVQGDWDRALAAHDRAGMILTLRRVRLSEHDAARTADSVLRDPGKYGF
ncbi:hypothetical protein BH09VER1_BH09VER1_44110 [soil metagenome]